METSGTLLLFPPRSRFDPSTLMSRGERAFWVFHRDNPHVWSEFQRYVGTMLGRGFTHYSALGLLHVIRFHTQLETSDPTFKINNNHSPYYARLWLQEHPEAPAFFETRILQQKVRSHEEDESELG